MIEIRVGAKNDGDRKIELYAEKWDIENSASKLIDSLDLDLPSGISLTRSIKNPNERDDAMVESYAAAKDLISIAIKKLIASGWEAVTEDPFWSERFYPNS